MEATCVGDLRQWQVWREVEVGTSPTADLLMLSLVGLRENQLTDWAKWVLSGVPLVGARRRVPLVLAAVCELGFTEPVGARAILGRAAEVGLPLLPPEAGPQLRGQYRHQFVGEKLTVPMLPHPGCPKNQTLAWVLGYDGRQWWMDVDAVTSNRKLYEPADLWVFGLPAAP